MSDDLRRYCRSSSVSTCTRWARLPSSRCSISQVHTIWKAKLGQYLFVALGLGKPTWILMEIVSPLTMLYTVFTNPERNSPLPGSHQWLIFLFCVHYFHRSIISPLRYICTLHTSGGLRLTPTHRNPSMAPVHIIIAFCAVVFNLINGSLIGGWLGGYGSASSVPAWQLLSGSFIWAAGFCGNIYHEEILRNIRRDGPIDKEHEGRVVVDNGRVYRVPEGGLFRLIWHPHVGLNPGIFWLRAELLSLRGSSIFRNGLSGQGIPSPAAAFTTSAQRQCLSSTRLLRCFQGLCSMLLRS